MPGGNTGWLRMGLSWFNWQNPGTQADMKKIMEDTAPLFKQFILDDFFCTADTSYVKTGKRGENMVGIPAAVCSPDSGIPVYSSGKRKNPDIK